MKHDASYLQAVTHAQLVERFFAAAFNIYR